MQRLHQKTPQQRSNLKYKEISHMKNERLTLIKMGEIHINYSIQYSVIKDIAMCLKKEEISIECKKQFYSEIQEASTCKVWLKLIGHKKKNTGFSVEEKLLS